MEISLLTAQNKSQQDQLAALQTLLKEAKETSRRVNEAKELTEEQSVTRMAKPNASVTDKDNIIVGAVTYGPRIFADPAADKIQQEIGEFVFEN